MAAGSVSCWVCIIHCVWGADSLANVCATWCASWGRHVWLYDAYLRRLNANERVSADDENTSAASPHGDFSASVECTVQRQPCVSTAPHWESGGPKRPAASREATCALSPACTRRRQGGKSLLQSTHADSTPPRPTPSLRQPGRS
jgi:hypothetical protein